MQLEIILFAILCNYLRKHLRKQNDTSGWDYILSGGIIFSVLMVVTDIALPAVRTFNSVLANLILFGTAYVILTREEFRLVRYIVYTFLPLVIVNFIDDIAGLIAPSFADRFKNIFDVAQFFSFVWLFVMLFIYNKQRKTLEKERRKAAEQEKELQITGALKAQLEIQVAERTAEIMAQKEELEKAIEELKATQDQLIHAEKMASLGELTAGIAHEIQNPLNFVNNFAEINAELIGEIKAELDAGNPEEVLAIANDIKDNNDKIFHHGKRADSIVKGMLQHSRKSSGVKEPTDINNLLDECIRLSYHGLRAKDKSFNSNFAMELGENVGKVNVVPQDIGRVFLNIMNNAFYAVAEKKLQSTDPGYQPMLTVKSCRDADKVVITISDNGNGIPKAVQEKIFQPFFTTKPTGKGTGLGLSISYDIVVKGHGGKINIESKEGESTSFVIELPAKEE